MKRIERPQRLVGQTTGELLMNEGSHSERGRAGADPGLDDSWIGKKAGGCQSQKGGD